MKKLPLITAISLALASQMAMAEVTVAEAEKLKNELTPVGAERAGNKDGSIPAWTGGITSPVAGYKNGDHHADPFSTDGVSFTITNANLDKYKAFLTPGQVKMFATYPDSFKMNVYPTRRSA